MPRMCRINISCSQSCSSTSPQLYIRVHLPLPGRIAHSGTTAQGTTLTMQQSTAAAACDCMAHAAKAALLSLRLEPKALV